MTIATDMCSALTLLARLRAILAQDPAHRSSAAALSGVQAVLEDCRVRAAEIEAAPIAPPHWQRQRAPTEAEVAAGKVVILSQAKQARAVAQVVRL